MTGVLWICIAVLTVVAMLFMLVPILRYRQGAALLPLEARKQKNREVFAQRQQELEQEVTDGLIAQDDMQLLKTELQRAFMRDMEALEQQQGSAVRLPAGKFVPYVFVVLVPIFSLLIYQQWGASQDLALPELLGRISASEDADTQLVLLNELATELQARVERKPEDLQGAYLLGTLFEDLEKFAEAAAIFQHMQTQMDEGPDMATVLGKLARNQYQLSDSKLTAQVQGTIDAALSMNPNEYSVMAILANDAFFREDFVAALGYWRRQLSSASPGSQQAASLRQVITMVEASLPEADQQVQAATGGPSITVTVNVDPGFADQLGKMQRMYIYVRNPNIPMPILAMPLDVLPEFPFTITLDNSQTMMGMTLESAPTLIVGARLSASGNATAQSGDLQTVSEPFVLSEQDGPVTLTIDQLVP